MGRSPCCDKSKVKRGSWSPEEDATLKSYLLKHGTATNWIALPQKAGLRRCGKSCRLRWLNYLRPDIKHGAFTPHEENIICDLYKKIGSRWSVIASQLQGRTDNDVKNFWNTKLKKKLMASDNTTPSTNYNPQNAPTASTSAVSLDQTPTSFRPSINSQTFREPDLGENSCTTGSYKPTNGNYPRLVLEGSGAGNTLNFWQSHQELSSNFGAFGFGGDDQSYGVSIDDEYSCQVMSGIWSQEDVFGADGNADLFSIFQC